MRLSPLYVVCIRRLLQTGPPAFTVTHEPPEAGSRPLSFLVKSDESGARLRLLPRTGPRRQRQAQAGAVPQVASV